MAFRNLLQISRYLSNSTRLRNDILCLNNSCKSELQSRRSYAKNSSKEIAIIPPSCEEDCCPNKTCTKEKKSSFWKGLFKDKSEEKPPIESCKIKQRLDECKKDPDLSHLGGKAFRTCGTAYIIQKDMLPSTTCEVSTEANILKRMEASFGHKETAVDPIPHFTTVEQRMLDLTMQKLHPFYKRYHNVPKKKRLEPLQKKPSKQTFDPHYIPVQLKINHGLLHMKNIIVSYKRVEPPAQFPVHSLDSRKKGAKRAKLPVIPEDSKDVPKHTKVFDTLYQKATVV